VLKALLQGSIKNIQYYFWRDFKACAKEYQYILILIGNLSCFLAYVMGLRIPERRTRHLVTIAASRSNYEQSSHNFRGRK